MTTEPAFVGAKIALIEGGRVLTYLRDDRPNLPFPGYWDFPGGGREGDEPAVDCALRELREEFGLILPAERLIWRREFDSHHVPGSRAVFFAGHIRPEEIGRVVFGEEGQRWEMMAIAAFLTHGRAVPYLRDRLCDAVASGRL